MEPHEAASAAIRDELGRLPLIKENYDRRRYSLPGGAVEDGETPLDTVIRETREETGVLVSVNHVVGVYRLVNGLTVMLLYALGDVLCGRRGVVRDALPRIN